jgi:hypothetical protein
MDQWRYFRVVSAAIIAGCIFGARLAEADNSNIDVYGQVRRSDPRDPKQAGRAPRVEVTVIGGAKVPLDKFALSTTHENQKVTVKAERLREYAEGAETLAIALVINVQNTSIDADNCVRDPALLAHIASAIDKVRLGTAAPPGSKGVVVSYSSGAEIRVPMGDLTFITGSALGTNKDYSGIGNDMVQGIRLGMAELSRVTTARKALIVIGEGNDANAEVANRVTTDLTSQAHNQNIQLFAIIYKDLIAREKTVITAMIPSAKKADSSEGIAVELNNIVARMADRYYLTFPGYDENTGIGLPWDGRDHNLILTIDQTDLNPFTLTLAPQWGRSRTGFPWIVTSTIAATAMLLLVALWILMRRKSR